MNLKTWCCEISVLVEHFFCHVADAYIEQEESSQRTIFLQQILVNLQLRAITSSRDLWDLSHNTERIEQQILFRQRRHGNYN